MTVAAAVSVRGLTLAYGDVEAVRDVTFEVRPGELYALLGADGAGKTSALEVIEGRRRPTSGSVRVLGHDPRDRHATGPRMGIVPQERGFSADLTVRDTVRLIGVLSQRDDRVERVLEVVGLADRSCLRTSRLSDGERRRLDLAFAAHGAPELVFLDEPTTGLDRESRDDLWAVVERLRTDGSTVVLTTRYLDEAQQRADRIGLLHHGRLDREGTVAELTRTLPAYISVRLPEGAPPPPLRVTRTDRSRARIETFTLEQDLRTLLDWSRATGVPLEELEAGPSRLDDVFRSLDRV